MVGFSLAHLHPLFFFSGALCSYFLILWLLIAVTLVIKRWKSVSSVDMVMVFLSMFVALVIVIP